MKDDKVIDACFTLNYALRVARHFKVEQARYMDFIIESLAAVLSDLERDLDLPNHKEKKNE